MLILTKAVLAMMIGFILSVIFGLFLIPLLKKINVKQNESTYLQKTHKDKVGTPTMGGLIFIIPTILTIFILLLLGKIEFSNHLLIVLFVFISYAFLGFIDDYLIIKRKNNIGLTEIQKLIGQILIAVVFYFIYMKSGASSTIEIHTFNITINLGWFYFLFILFMLVASSNAVNITDGLDGLAGGLSVMAFLAFIFSPLPFCLWQFYPLSDVEHFVRRKSVELRQLCDRAPFALRDLREAVARPHRVELDFRF